MTAADCGDKRPNTRSIDVFQSLHFLSLILSKITILGVARCPYLSKVPSRGAFDCDSYLTAWVRQYRQSGYIMAFEHPLARTSHIGATAGMNGQIRHILVIITGLQIDKEHKKYNEDAICRLSDAARSWLEDHPGEAEDFMLMNRPKKWVGDKE